MAKQSNQQVINHPKSPSALPYFLLIIWATILMSVVFLHFSTPNNSLLSFLPRTALVKISPTLINLLNGPLRKTVVVETNSTSVSNSEAEAQDQLLRADISLKQQITPAALLLKADALVTLGQNEQAEVLLNQAQLLDPNTQSTQDLIKHIRERLALSNNQNPH